MSLAEVLKLIHIVAVIVWVGGSFMLIVLLEMSRRSSEEPTVLGLSRIGENVGKFVFNPAGILALAAGVWLVIEADFEFSEAWISLGFLGVILSAGLGMAFYPKALRRLQAGIERDGLAGAESVASLDRLRLVSSVELLLLLIVVWAMVAKPGA